VRVSPNSSGETLFSKHAACGRRARQAANQLHEILAATPDNLEAIDTIAATEMELGKPEDAARRLEDALRKFPAHLQTAFELARIKLAQKEFGAAEEILVKAMATAPQSADAALAVGDFYFARREPEKAEPAIRNIMLRWKRASLSLGFRCNAVSSSACASRGLLSLTHSETRRVRVSRSSGSSLTRFRLSDCRQLPGSSHGQAIDSAAGVSPRYVLLEIGPARIGTKDDSRRPGQRSQPVANGARLVERAPNTHSS
jgi:tetratricopeptide (TPR) repeat protein